MEEILVPRDLRKVCIMVFLFGKFKTPTWRLHELFWC